MHTRPHGTVLICNLLLHNAAAFKGAALTQKPSGPVTPVASSKLMLMAELDLATCCTAFPAKLLGATNALAAPMTAATATIPAFMMSRWVDERRGVKQNAQLLDPSLQARKHRPPYLQCDLPPHVILHQAHGEVQVRVREAV
jgi:hypothetical protein